MPLFISNFYKSIALLLLIPPTPPKPPRSSPNPSLSPTTTRPSFPIIVQITRFLHLWSILHSRAILSRISPSLLQPLTLRSRLRKRKPTFLIISNKLNFSKCLDSRFNRSLSNSQWTSILPSIQNTFTLSKKTNFGALYPRISFPKAILQMLCASSNNTTS